MSSASATGTAEPAVDATRRRDGESCAATRGTSLRGRIAGRRRVAGPRRRRATATTTRSPAAARRDRSDRSPPPSHRPFSARSTTAEVVQRAENVRAAHRCRDDNPPVDLSYRPVTVDELAAYCRACATGFGESLDWYEKHPQWAALEPERTVAAFDGDAIVGTSRNFSLELTVPGGAVLPVAGVSAVAVLPTHTRRGVLRAMMTILLDDAVAREEPVAMLTASEGGIYGRFGFGITIRTMRMEITTSEIEFASARPSGQLRMLDLDAARKLEPEVFDRARRDRPGAVSRPDAWWPAEQPDPCVRRRRAHPRGRARAVAAPLRGGPRPQDRRLAYSSRQPTAVDAGVGPRCPDERHRLRRDPRARW